MRYRTETMMACAYAFASNSYAKRKQVGAVIAKDNRIIATGYNGTPPEMCNTCEKDDVTIPEVVHAELNAILFAARHGVALEGCTLYVTLAPCLPCSTAILQAGIRKVVYNEAYRNMEGVELLSKHIDVWTPNKEKEA